MRPLTEAEKHDNEILTKLQHKVAVRDAVRIKEAVRKMGRFIHRSFKHGVSRYRTLHK